MASNDRPNDTEEERPSKRPRMEDDAASILRQVLIPNKPGWSTLYCACKKLLTQNGKDCKEM